MSNDFLPEGYEAPKAGGGYMKITKGENRLRILSKPVIGWQDWDNKKPLRFKMNNKPASPIDPSKKIKHFWAFVVWNYSSNQIEILEITQATIQGAIQALSKDNDWGSPFEYDIKITRTGEDLLTEYSINPIPHKKLAPEIVKAYKDKPVNLNALFDGADPFDCKEVIVNDDLPF